MSPAPFTIRVYSPTRKLLGTLKRPLSVRAVIRHNALSTAEISVDLDDQLSPALLSPGTRVEVDFRGAYLMGGAVDTSAAQGLTGQGVVTATVVDDWSLLQTLLTYPAPFSPLSDQSRPQFVLSNYTAEAAAKSLIEQNVSRRPGNTVVVVPSRGQGQNVTVVARMHTAADRLFPLLDRAGIGLRLTPTGPVTQRTGLQLDAYVPKTIARTLTERSGVILDWKLTRQRPTVTRVVVMGGGEGQLRDFRSFADTAREAAWGCVLEVPVDARDARSEYDGTMRNIEQAYNTLSQRSSDLSNTRGDYNAALSDYNVKTSAVYVAQSDYNRYAGSIPTLQQRSYLAFLNSQYKKTDSYQIPDGAAYQYQRDAAARAISAADAASNQADAEVTTATNNRNAASSALSSAQSAQTAAQTTLNSRSTQVTAAQAQVNQAYASISSLGDTATTQHAAYETELARRAAVRLAEGDAQSGVTVSFGETARFSYGTGPGVVVTAGDQVKLELVAPTATAPGVTVTEVVREAELEWTAQGGLVVTPTIGSNLDDPDVSAARATAALAGTIRNIQTRS